MFDSLAVARRPTDAGIDRDLAEAAGIRTAAMNAVLRLLID